MYDDPQLMKYAFVYLQDYMIYGSSIIYDRMNRTNAFRKHGIARTNYEMLYAKQGGCCAICKKVKASLDVDHCHTSRLVRGLLCSTCNKGLGLFQDDAMILLSGAYYVAASNLPYK
jgi:hypothetical protein